MWQTAKCKKWLNLLTGFYPMTVVRTLQGMPFFLRDLKRLQQQRKRSGEGKNEFPLGNYWPILNERFADAGTMSGDYFFQDLYVAKKIFRANPQKHVDIGSRIDGFVAHVATFREIEIFDIRKIENTVPNILFKQADLMKLPKGMESYCDSISSLHAIEHFGLGRYGDPVDYYGHVKAIKNITTILKQGGTFYFSVPIGQQRIEFNAHRIFSLSYLWGLLKDDYELVSFSYVDDKGIFHEEALFAENTYEVDFKTDFTWGCAVFELIKK
jgi:SAM-dependent methyltransferase